ncbi:MAG TPA: Asp-tRNA(Asn)/Glu-tRNA(Gln) amidotransferase subunit GatC [Gemmatimonadaceae bacterium]|nr:Asp-tRNA(Asn)/Glu-tRNA(Gln) amidotransferase subunit GatC [Gemmatimonadaceae bacterium]
MSVSEQDVRHIAALARLGLDEASVSRLATELNGILAHMEELNAVDTAGVDAITGVGSGGTPLRVDSGPQYPLRRGREDFAPEMRDGFFIVPRLATHEGLDAALDAALDSSLDDVEDAG